MKNTMNFKLFLSFIIILIITGCGGGGSSNSSPSIYEIYPVRKLDATGESGVRAAAVVADAGQTAARGALRLAFTQTVTEQDVVDAVLAAYTAAGADAEPCYPPIIASRGDALLPNGDLSNDRTQTIPADGTPVLVGLAPRVNGYCAVAARTYFLGAPTDEMQTVYELTNNALDAGAAAVATGADTAAVNAAMYDALAAGGYGAYMTWSPGFGLYTYVHAGPLIAPDYHYALQPVQALALEPGAIIPGRFGIRLMDTVLLTSNGTEILSTTPRDFNSAVLAP